MSKRQPTQHAQVAKLIKAELRSYGIKCTVKSSSFSMGNSVDVNVENQPPWIMKAIEAQTDKYEYGTFDSMTDCQGTKNRDFDGPQTKYLSINNYYTAELKQAAWVELCDRMQELQGLEDKEPHTVRMEQANCYGSDFLYRYLNGSQSGFCYFKKPVKKLETTVSTEVEEFTGDYTIEEHTHTKRNVQIFICVNVERVSKEEFDAERKRAKALFGWYSRKWESIPCGFAFSSIKAAKTFAGIPTTPDDEPTKLENVSIECVSDVVKINQSVDLKEGSNQEDDQQIVDNAIAILADKIKEPEMVANNPSVIKAYLTVKLSERKNEVFCVLFLDNQHNVIEFEELFFGTINAASVHPRVVVQRALAHNAAAVILAHNHPSGRCKPSLADKDITNTLKKILNIIDVRLLDHIIVAGADTYSFAQNGDI